MGQGSGGDWGTRKVGVGVSGRLGSGVGFERLGSGGVGVRGLGLTRKIGIRGVGVKGELELGESWVGGELASGGWGVEVGGIGVGKVIIGELGLGKLESGELGSKKLETSSTPLISTLSTPSSPRPQHP